VLINLTTKKSATAGLTDIVMSAVYKFHKIYRKAQRTDSLVFIQHAYGRKQIHDHTFKTLRGYGTVHIYTENTSKILTLNTIQQTGLEFGFVHNSVNIFSFLSFAIEMFHFTLSEMGQILNSASPCQFFNHPHTRIQTGSSNDELQTCIRGMLDSNLGWNTAYDDLGSFLVLEGEWWKSSSIRPLPLPPKSYPILQSSHA
jgi:hypothetical protein